jgi:Zn-dependent protease
VNVDVQLILMYLVVLFFSLSIHESAHAWTAERFGDPTGRRLGRVTLNPLPHVDLVGTFLVPLVGFLAGGLIFGWAKPVPVNGANLRDPRRAHLFIAAAGPASNVLAAIGFLIGLRLLAVMSGPAELQGIVAPLEMLCRAGLYLNVILAVFNLLPIPPLDGSWILEGVLPGAFSRLFAAVRPYGFLLLVMLLYTGWLGKIISPVMRTVQILAG